jgi:hypothetical protein
MSSLLAPAASPLRHSDAMTRTVRDSLLQAVDEISDQELQERLWVRGERRNENEHGFDDAVNLVIDELERTDPAELVGYVLRDEAELGSFSRLATALDRLLIVIGPHGTFRDALDSGQPWIDCVEAAQSLREMLSA